jgi:hypothetical protein
MIVWTPALIFFHWCGSGSAWICIQFGRWIRIQLLNAGSVQLLKNKKMLKLKSTSKFIFMWILFVGKLCYIGSQFVDFSMWDFISFWQNLVMLAKFLKLLLFFLIRFENNIFKYIFTWYFLMCGTMSFFI